MRLGLSQGLSTGGFVPSASVFTNSKSLAFDGTNEHLTTTADSTLATKTYSFWAKSSNTARYGVYDHGGSVGGVLFFNWSNKPALYNGTGYYVFWEDNPAQDDGNWHHWLLYQKHDDIAASKLYCDGVLQSISTTSTGDGAGTAYTSGIKIGSQHYPFSGHLDEFAIFDGDKTGIVADLYNSGVPTNLASTAGLEHWWRMGDATEPAADGTGSHSNKLHILDQANTTLGSEMVISDAYDSDNWYVYSGNTMTFGDDFMRCERTASGDSNGWFAYLRTSASDNSILTATPTTDSFYLLTFDVESDDADAYVYMKFGNVASTILSGTGNGTKTVVYKKGSSGHVDYLEGRNLSQGKYMKISNVSVKEILGATAEMTNMDSGDIVQYTPNSYILSDLGITPDLAVSMTRKLVSDYSGDFFATSGSDVTAVLDQSENGTLGSELVTNGDYETGDFTGWTLFGADTQTIEVATNAAGSNAAHLVTDGTYASVYQALTPASGTVVKLTFDVQIVTGTLVVTDGTDTTSYGTSGSYVRYITSDGHIALEFKRSAGATEFYVDNVSVKEVSGKHLTNYDNVNVGNDAQLSGSGNSARATFSSVDNTVLTTSTLGSAFPAGNHDVFMVFDPVGTDQQILFGRASTGGDFLAMDNGSSSNASNGITIGEIRVNDTILPATVSRNELWDAMTVSGTMGGLNVLSLEDVDLSSIGGHIRLGSTNNTWRLEGAFAEFIITPPLTDAEHSAIVENIRAHYDAP